MNSYTMLTPAAPAPAPAPSLRDRGDELARAGLGIARTAQPVTVRGFVVALGMPPGAGHAAEAVATVDDGTARADFTVARADMGGLLGRIVDVTGVLTRADGRPLRLAEATWVLAAPAEDA